MSMTSKLLCVFGVLGITSGCLTPSVSPTTAGPDGTTVASAPVPSPVSATKDDGPSEAEAPAPEVEIERMAEEEKSPTWMAPTDGFIGCVEALWAAAHVSLETGAVMTAEDLAVKLKVKNPETGEEEPLEAHALVAETEVTLPEELLKGIQDAIHEGTLRRVGEASSPEEESGPTSLKVTMKINTTRPTDPTLRDACAPERAYMRSKIFVLEGNYRSRLIPYSGQGEFQLVPEETFTGLDKIVLTRPRLAIPERVIKARFKAHP
jgi:hypothetical protein